MTGYVMSHRELFIRSGQRSFFGVGVFLSGLAFLLPVANLVGWPLAPNGGLYLAMVWLILGLGSINFLGLVLSRLVEPRTG